MLRLACRSLLAALFLCVSLGAWADAVTDRAKLLLQRKDAEAAYKLLLPLEPQRAGDPEFDYLLGIAALDAGQPERAIFALERVLAVQPGNLQARAEIARAYMATGEREAAKREFRAVREREVPADVRRTIDGFLSAIAAAERTQLARYLEVAFGYDTNINSATSLTSVAVPAVGNLQFTLDPAQSERDDRFLNVAAGLSFTRKLNVSWAVVGGISGNLRQNLYKSGFNNDTLDGSLGMRFTRGRHAMTVGAQGQYFEVESETYRNTLGGVAQWQYSFDELTQATVFAQHAAQRYEKAQQSRDSDRTIIGAAYAQAFSGAYSPVVFLSAYGGEDAVVDDAFGYFGNKPVGVRFGLQFRLGGGWSAFGNASYERREYDGIDPLFLIVREDKQTDASAGVSYLWRSGTTVRLQVAHTANDSNIPTNEFKRTVVSIATRFNF